MCNNADTGNLRAALIDYSKEHDIRKSKLVRGLLLDKIGYGEK